MTEQQPAIPSWNTLLFLEDVVLLHRAYLNHAGNELFGVSVCVNICIYILPAQANVKVDEVCPVIAAWNVLR